MDAGVAALLAELREVFIFLVKLAVKCFPILARLSPLAFFPITVQLPTNLPTFFTLPEPIAAFLSSWIAYLGLSQLVKPLPASFSISLQLPMRFKMSTSFR